MGDQSMASGKQTKKRPQSKMAPFPNTVHNADSMNENSFEWCDARTLMSMASTPTAHEVIWNYAKTVIRF